MDLAFRACYRQESRAEMKSLRAKLILNWFILSVALLLPSSLRQISRLVHQLKQNIEGDWL